MSKTVVILQSNYIPWKGYFSQILLADFFIFLDDVQYTKRDWRNRNKIKTKDGLKWFSVPCVSKRESRICDVEILNHSWQEKHWKSITHAYSKAKYFDEYKGFFEDIYLKFKWDNLSRMNQYIIKSISQDIFEFNTLFIDSSKFKSKNKKLQKILDILGKIEGVTDYLTGPSAKEYLSGCEVEFEKRNIKLHYMDYSGFYTYPQLFGKFVHEVSIIDLIFNTGKYAKEYLKNSLTEKMSLMV